MVNLPTTKNRDIIVQELGGEILIYDLAANKAFSLNETATLVYRSCDGKTSLEEFKRHSGIADEMIFLALDTLEKENLIEKDTRVQTAFGGMTRREAIRKAGLASMAMLPVITGLLAPTAAHAQSGGAAACIPDGQPSAVPNYPTPDPSSCYSATPDASCCSGISNGLYNGGSQTCVLRTCGAGSFGEP